MVALKSESAAQAGAAEKARREREASERTEMEQRKADERRRHQERLADEQRRRQEQARNEAATAVMISDSEQRLTRKIEAIRPPKKEQLRILYATATSRGDLRVDEEIRRVKATVKSATHRDQVIIDHLPAATPGDLLDGLSAFRPHIVHFSGHGSDNVLVFDAGAETHNEGRRVAAGAFKNALEAPDEPPTLVVLNACRSAAQLQSLLGKVLMAVGMKESIGDADALTFATRFYRTLAEGQSVSAALAAHAPTWR